MTFIRATEQDIFVWINTTISNSFFDFTMPLFDKERPIAVIVVLIMAPVLVIGSKKLKGTLALILASVVLTYCINGVFLKSHVQRLRPYHNNEFASMVTLRSEKEPVDDYSFPSTHTAIAFGIALLCAVRHRKAAFVLYPIAVLMGFSRVYVGVHYPFDVAAGAISGSMAAFAVLLAWNHLFPAISQNTQPGEKSA